MSFSYAGAQDEIDQKISSSDLENAFVGTAIAKLLGAEVSNVQNSANQDPLRHPPRSPPAASRVLAAIVADHLRRDSSCFFRPARAQGDCLDQRAAQYAPSVKQWPPFLA